MNRIAAASAALLASTALAQAGGLDRNQTTPGILFEDGTYVELGYSFVNPNVDGTLAVAPVPSGEISPTYSYPTLSYHQQLSEGLSFGLIIDAPYGADVDYPAGSYPFAGSRAEVRTQQLTLALRYQLNDNVSVYGGLRALRGQANDVYVTAPSGGGFSYRLDAESDTGYGFLIGGAYEIPEIALRVALTYYSEVDLSLSGLEGIVPTQGVPSGGIPTTGPGGGAADFGITLPQSVLLEAQSGIAEDTLLFGSLRWTNWDGFSIVPGRYPPGGTGALVEYDSDVWTWTVGVGRRINDDLSVSGSLTYEAEQDGFSGNLGPTDGRLSLGIGAEYQVTDTVTIAGGVQYTRIGDAQTEGTPAGTVLANFNDNDALAVGLRVGIQF
jgi:long-subunit fatty acid transport protein